MNTLQKITILAVTLLALSGCGAVADLAYDSAPTYVASELEDAFDLDDAQIRQLDGRLVDFFDWHRAQELVRYREVLEAAATASADGIEAAEFMRLRGEIRAAWRRSFDKAIDSLGDLAVNLDPEQIDRFDTWFREGSREFEEYLEKSPQQREIIRVEEHLDRLENWFGDFDFETRKKVRARLEQLPDLYEPWLRYRSARHQALVSALRDIARDGPDPDRLKAVISPDSDYARAYEPARVAFWQAYAVVLEDVSGWVSERQLQRVASKLRDYAEIAGRLSRG
jgi:hypothetical protein